jgi:polyphosphate:AMP phosphotransferase
MFESAELDHAVARADYQREKVRLREALLEAQLELVRQKRFAVLILIEGMDAAGKGETVQLLNDWMDPRYIHTHAFDPVPEKQQRPAMYRYWRVLPPKGEIAIFFGAWQSAGLERLREGRAEGAVEESVRMEKMLTAEGVLVVKLWFHLSKKQQKKRLKALEKAPQTRWRVTESDWDHYAHYDERRTAAESFLRRTSTAEAPWFVVAGADRRYRNLRVGDILLGALRRRLEQPEPIDVADEAPPAPPPLDDRDVLHALDYTLHLTDKEYDDELERWQGKLNRLSRHPHFRRLAVVAVFEGADAAGKGGSIRRVTGALDPRCYHVIPIAAPTDEERARPYLWRFWRHVPRRGRFAIFDRSWYGRVLVERVERLCPEEDWRRAYAEINDFEAQLARHGIVICKFWLAITKEEQLARFEAREGTSFKRFKITPEDWRNRGQWEAYERAVCDMVDRTSTEIAPWTLVEANDKKFARIEVLKTLCAAGTSAVRGR